MRLLKRLFARRTSAPVIQQPAEQSPYAPVWTTGAAPEDDAEQFVGALRTAFAEELIGEDGAR